LPQGQGAGQSPKKIGTLQAVRGAEDEGDDKGDDDAKTGMVYHLAESNGRFHFSLLPRSECTKYAHGFQVQLFLLQA
jgi:hypothetical protein